MTIEVDTDKAYERLNAETPEAPAEPAPESKPEAAATNAEDKKDPPEPTPQEAPKAETHDAFEIVHNGEVKRLKREELLSLAQMGFDYTKKTQGLAEQKRELERLYKEVEPIYADYQARKKKEKEEEEQDPLIRAERRSERAEKLATDLTETLKREKEAAAVKEATDALQRDIVSAKEKVDLFKKIPSGSNGDLLRKRMDTMILAGVAYGGLTPEQSVREVASALEEFVRAERETYLQSKVEDAKRSPVPRPGAPTPARAKAFTAADLKSGAVADAALRRFR